MADNNTTNGGNATATNTNAVPKATLGINSGTQAGVEAHMAKGTADDNSTRGGGTGADGGFDWTIFWAVLAVAVFFILWRTGKLQAIRKYVAEAREQLAKCTWPTKGELKQHIVVVLLSSVLLAAFTVAADFIVRELVWGLLLDGDTVLNTPTDK